MLFVEPGSSLPYSQYSFLVRLSLHILAQLLIQMNVYLFVDYLKTSVDQKT
jgi:hypothetical protein